MLSIVVAHDEKKVIGYQGWMPWKLPEDLKQFKDRTVNHTIVMGKVTFHTIGKPLPNRKTIVVCYEEEKEQFQIDNVEVCTDFKQFLLDHQHTEEEVFICGGASIYRQAMPYCKKMYISLVDGEHPVDTYFPDYNESDYTVLSITPFTGFKVIEYVKKDAYES